VEQIVAAETFSQPMFDSAALSPAL
ncbi:MAG: oxidoreductase, partial [Rhodococcus sp. (in: high G+C Gram-positive bacteria)]